MKKIMILGSNGMLGHKLFNVFNNSKEVECIGTCRKKELLKDNILYLDPSEGFSELQKIVDDFNIDIIINCIGIIKQKKEADTFESCVGINSILPEMLGYFGIDNNIKIIHISTDCVFSGLVGNYKESDVPDPIDVYGKSKLLGEINDDHNLTIRTSIIGREIDTSYGLLEWIIASKGKDVYGYTNAIYTGFTTKELANVMLEYVIPNIDSLNGIYHISSDPISKYDLLKLINEEFNLGINILKNDEVKCDRSLNSDRFRNKFGFKPKSWDIMIKDLVNDNI